jgi:hypothetical protein
MAEGGGANAKVLPQFGCRIGSEWLAELHWYESTGTGKKEFKIKRFIG